MGFDLKNKIVLVTGGSMGIGANIVKILLEEGVKHVTFIDVLEKEGIQHQNELNEKYGDKVKYYKCDVTVEEQLFGAFESVKDKYGYIDVVINNAGIANDGPELFKKEIQINLTALVTSTFKAIEVMRKDNGGKGGVVLNVSSVAALSQHHVLSVYSATKSAVLQFSNCIGLPEYYSKTGVRVVTICFGVTDSTMLTRKDLTNFDATFNTDLKTIVDSRSPQKCESAAKGAVEAAKRGESGSTWLSIGDKPVQDITDYVKRSYQIFEELLH